MATIRPSWVSTAPTRIIPATRDCCEVAAPPSDSAQGVGPATEGEGRTEMQAARKPLEAPSCRAGPVVGGKAALVRPHIC